MSAPPAPTPPTPTPSTPTPPIPTPATAGLLEGRVAVVTGAGRGIGRAIAAALAAQGAQVALADVDLAGVSAAADEIGEATGTPALALEVDVTRPDSVSAAADTVERTFGLCDVVVTNAGILVFAPDRKSVV